MEQRCQGSLAAIAGVNTRQPLSTKTRGGWPHERSLTMAGASRHGRANNQRTTPQALRLRGCYECQHALGNHVGLVWLRCCAVVGCDPCCSSINGCVRLTGFLKKAGRPDQRAAGLSSLVGGMFYCGSGRCVRATSGCHQCAGLGVPSLLLVSEPIVGPARLPRSFRGCHGSTRVICKLRSRGPGTVQCAGPCQPGFSPTLESAAA